ncbi:hypothetical protein GJ744_000650 [Endocarpon pusillum]|uniref:Uncharacterized protein n=1 Tax=Endocarpon pusillum TaxID=364733 RepID=A0A8H7E1R5_9EURO|nr:hypothetical protein GJ744_000650 [Endocarpon pusillum]
MTAAFGALGRGLTLASGAWMVVDNRMSDRKQGGGKVRAGDVKTELLRDGPKVKED